MSKSMDFKLTLLEQNRTAMILLPFIVWGTLLILGSCGTLYNIDICYDLFIIVSWISFFGKVFYGLMLIDIPCLLRKYMKYRAIVSLFFIAVIIIMLIFTEHFCMLILYIVIAWSYIIRFM